MNRIDENLWTVDAEMRFAGFPLGLRSTILRLEDRSVWVHSPVPLTDALRSSVEQIGPVGHIVTGANTHNLHLLEWVQAFPQASVHVTRGIPNKIKELKRYRLLDGNEFPHDFDAARMAGVPMFDEHVFFHRATRSLIVTDFIQNHPPELMPGWIQRQVFAALGFKGICAAPSLRFAFMVKDQRAFEAFCRKLKSFDVKRIIVTHGPIIDQDANTVIHRLTERFLTASGSSSAA